MTLYIYEQNKKYKGMGFEIKAVAMIKETNFSATVEKLAYIFEWFSVGFLFYLNSHYIHSRLFSIFVFICAINLLFTIGVKKKVGTKEEFLQKVEEICKEEQ